MSKIYLTIQSKSGLSKLYFNTITDAYHFYLDNFVTFGEWFYYLRVAHTRLGKVTDEGIMECIFRNVFSLDIELHVEEE